MVKATKARRWGGERGHDVGDVGGLKMKRVAETVNVPVSDETIKPSNHDISRPPRDAFNYCKSSRQWVPHVAETCT
jgi:hypothetical protein